VHGGWVTGPAVEHTDVPCSICCADSGWQQQSTSCRHYVPHIPSAHAQHNRGV
jgi:hypothetical protein